jgi:hypothetical protein
MTIVKSIEPGVLLCPFCGVSATILIDHEVSCTQLSLRISLPVCAAEECVRAGVDFIANYHDVRGQYVTAHA